tara:strand:+ start:52 stop:498 length:447 start_codon:yes stop_codon:yes gene_type:complete
MWQDILKTINIATGKTKTVDLPIIEDEDDDCERRFWYLWSMLEAELSGKKDKAYSLWETESMIINTTDKDYCAILDWLKKLDKLEFESAYPDYEEKLGDTLRVNIQKVFGAIDMEYLIDIYQFLSPQSLFMISIYDVERFLEVLRRHV